ncbi:MAG: hypothetical protein JJU36_11535 [Phycisphaeraceae bacterium]|nr:hypothetical protein [Phycisphaeraceae bacterium]
MSIDLTRHPYFESWRDPDSGVESFILTRRAGPFQRSNYYTTPSLSRDGRWLWFTVASPPTRSWTLAACCLDADEPRMVHFPHIVPGGNPLVLPEGDRVYVPVNESIYMQPVNGPPERVFRLPDELIANRRLDRLVTTLTMSADGRHFLLDAAIGNRWLIAVADRRTGEVTPLRWFFRNYHHAMFSPIDPDLFMIGQGPWHDPVSGEKGNIDIRMWLMDRGGTRFEPVQSDLWFNHNCESCHEWWTPDGMVNWCDYRDGVYEVDVTRPVGDRPRSLIWPRPLIHAHCCARRRLYVGDYHPYRWSEDRPCAVWFFDRKTGRELAIASAMPMPPIEPRELRAFHLDPHPQISPDGAHAIYTTSVRGAVDVAITPLAPLIA